MKRRTLIFAVAFALAQVLRALVLDWTTPELTRGGGEFVVGPLGPGAVVSQTFDMTSGGLAAVRVAGGDVQLSQGVVDARLYEVSTDGSERQVRSSALLRADDDCCDVRFASIPYSAHRRYRLELSVNQPAASTRITLRATAARDAGGLVINGRRQPANLVVETIGGDLGPLRGNRRVSFPLVLGAFAVVDGTLLVVLAALVAVRRI